MPKKISVSQIIFDRRYVLSGDPNGAGLMMNGSGIGGVASIPADVVRTTGDQLVNDKKRFGSGIYSNNTYLAINTEFRWLADVTGIRALDWYSGILYTNVGGGILSLNWKNRLLYNTSNAICVDWSACNLYDGGVPNSYPSIDWASRLSYDPTGTISTDYGSRHLYNSSSEITADWQNQQLLRTGSITVDWKNRVLSGVWNARDPNFINSLTVNNVAITTDASLNLYFLAALRASAYLFDENGSKPYFVGNGFSSSQIKSGSVTIVEFGDRTLSGNWKTNTSPTETGHLINKVYADSGYAKVTGSTNIAPAVTGTPSRWWNVVITGVTYKVPLYL